LGDPSPKKKKKPQNKIDWRHGSKGRATTLQGPEFKTPVPPSHKKKEKKKSRPTFDGIPKSILRYIIITLLAWKR
jgi:hypothetical protein